ncbi:MAG TPA: rod-binding protein [Rhizomicrobium sp.]
MMPGTDIQNAMLMAKSAPVSAPHPTKDLLKAKNAAKQFEGVFVSQFVSEMFQGLSTDGPTGGGEGEAMFRSMMTDEYSKQIVAQGGFGLADAVQRQLLKTQEVAQ